MYKLWPKDSILIKNFKEMMDEYLLNGENLENNVLIEQYSDEYLLVDDLKKSSDVECKFLILADPWKIENWSDLIGIVKEKAIKIVYLQSESTDSQDWYSNHQSDLDYILLYPFQKNIFKRIIRLSQQKVDLQLNELDHESQENVLDFETDADSIIESSPDIQLEESPLSDFEFSLDDSSLDEQKIIKEVTNIDELSIELNFDQDFDEKFNELELNLDSLNLKPETSHDLISSSVNEDFDEFEQKIKEIESMMEVTSTINTNDFNKGAIAEPEQNFVKPELKENRVISYESKILQEQIELEREDHRQQLRLRDQKINEIQRMRDCYLGEMEELKKLNEELQKKIHSVKENHQQLLISLKKVLSQFDQGSYLDRALNEIKNNLEN